MSFNPGERVKDLSFLSFSLTLIRPFSRSVASRRRPSIGSVLPSHLHKFGEALLVYRGERFRERLLIAGGLVRSMHIAPSPPPSTSLSSLSGLEQFLFISLPAAGKSMSSERRPSLNILCTTFPATLTHFITRVLGAKSELNAADH